MMKQKILFILPGFNFGGTVFSTLNMISFLQRDYDITVLPMTHQGPVKKKYLDSGISLYPESLLLDSIRGKLRNEKRIWRKLLLFSLKFLRKILACFQVDFEQVIYNYIAHRIEGRKHYNYVAACQEGDATYFAACFKKSNKIAWFRNEYSIYRTEYSQIALYKDQKIYPQFDKIVCVSKTTSVDFIKYFPNIENKIIPIHNIQDVANIIAKSNESISDYPESPFVIVSVGRINPQKRFSKIPSIARKMLDVGCKFKWIILGDGNVLGEWDKLQEEIINNDVIDTVLCLGSKLNPYPYIKRAQLLVNTSYVEACPRVVIEAKMLKTPVVCTDFSSAKEFVSSNYDGFVDTIDNIHFPIIEMINNRDTYDRIKKVCNSYEIDNEKIYEQLKLLFS